MPSIDTILTSLESIAPLSLAAEWDSVGLLVGQSAPRTIERVMTCLTLTPDVAEEAVRERAGLVVTHHPLPFRPIGRLTPSTMTGRSLLTLVAGGVAVYSPHTAWDSAAGGINDQLARILEVSCIRPIRPWSSLPDCGVGRLGMVAERTTVGDVAAILATRLGIPGSSIVGSTMSPAGLVGIVCGSGGDLVGEAIAAGCRTLVTGEIRLHAAEEARAGSLSVVAIGHHASESFSMGTLGRRLAEAVPGLLVFASRSDTDPLTWVGAAGKGLACT
ncbi:MAG: Nif3-like dinuclear metal center hexameric protein [Planctomycetaceae bacterium]